MTKLKRTFIVVSAVALICLSAPAGVRAGEKAGPNAAAPWWNSGWKKRLKVSVDVIYGEETGRNPWRKFDELNTGPLTAVATIHRKKPEKKENQDDVRVVDAQGREVPRKVYYLNEPDTLTVRFPAPQKGGDFFIYFDNSNPPPNKAGDWLPKPGSLTLTTLKVAATLYAGTLSQIKAVLRGNTAKQGKRPINLVAMHRNPAGLATGNNRYITCIEGLIRIEIAGEYKFSVDSGGPGFLLIGGELVASNSTRTNAPQNQWLTTESVILRKGYHHFRLLLSEMAPSQGARLGWRPPGKKRMVVVPADAFANHVTAVPREFSHFDGREELYFTTIPSSVGIVLNGGSPPDYHLAHLSSSKVRKMRVNKTVAPVELINLSTFDARSTRYEWKVNGTVKASARRATVPLELGRSHKITLEAYRGGRRLARETRSCRPFAQDTTHPRWRLETIGAPNIVFVGEQENLSFRIRSSMASAMLFDWDYVLRRPKGGSVIQRKSGTVSTTASTSIAAGEATLSFSLDTHLYDRDAEIVVILSASGVPLASSLFRVMPLGRGVRSLKPHIGSLVDGDGNRVIISTHMIDEAARRKWVLVRWVRVMIRSANGSIFFYGSSMKNAPCSGEEFVSYITLLQQRFTKAARKLDFVERTNESVCGILADVPKFGAALDARDPDAIVISPGPWDALRGVPVRDFERSLQLMLDMIRAKGTPTKTVLVSPPPLATNVNFSRLYRDATEKLAEQNRVEFVDIHDLLNTKDYLKYYRSKAGDGVHYTYPNNGGQESIADAIWQSID